jgi:hypothetical protein
MSALELNVSESELNVIRLKCLGLQQKPNGEDMPLERNAFVHLVDNELCEILTESGWHEARWSGERQCFFFIQDHGQHICPNEAILEWLPGSVKF